MKNSRIQTINTDSENCETLIPCNDPILARVRTLSIEKQLEWYKNNQELLCCNQDYYSCVVSYHRISSCDFETFARAHPDNQSIQINFYNLPIQVLKEKLKSYSGGCYDKHVEFDLTENPQTPEFINFVDFDPDNSHYSIPLLQGIINNIDDKSSGNYLNICKSIISGNERIIFSVNGVGYFNLSGDPGILPIPSPM